jgi:hypothetical protein
MASIQVAEIMYGSDRNYNIFHPLSLEEGDGSSWQTWPTPTAGEKAPRRPQSFTLTFPSEA